MGQISEEVKRERETLTMLKMIGTSFKDMLFERNGMDNIKDGGLINVKLR